MRSMVLMRRSGSPSPVGEGAGGEVRHMADGMPSPHRDDDGLDDLEITSLRPRSASGGKTLAKPPWFRSRRWRRLVIGMSLVLLIAILLGGQPFIRNPVQGMINATLFPTPLPTATALPT